MTTSTEDPDALENWIIQSEPELKEWAEVFSQKIEPPMVVLLDGPMGSGKTTLMRYLMEALQGDEASSPTFSLVNEYQFRDGMIYHFDLYRLDQTDDLEEIGFDEYVKSNAVSFIEWPQLGASYYEEDLTTTIRIEVLPDHKRKIQWFKGIAL